MQPPLFGALDALAVDDGGSRADLALLLLTALLIKRMVDAIQCAIVGPQIEIVVDRAFRRQVFRDRTPLATGGQNVHQAVDDLTHDHGALVATRFAGWYQSFDQLPLLVGQVARIAQLAAVVTDTVLARPHRVTPFSNQATTLESQPIHMIQLLPGQTLTLTKLVQVFASNRQDGRTTFGRKQISRMCCATKGPAMRETTLAFVPLVAAIYFTLFPSQFAVMLFWVSGLLR